MHWKTKSRVFRLLSLAPHAQELLFAIQKYVTKEVPRRESSLELLFDAAQEIFEAIQKHVSPRSAGDLKLVEIGAGRDLAVALALRMMGVGHITCVDITPMAKIDLVARAADFMARKLGVAAPVLNSMQDLERFGIRYLAPTTLRDAKIEAGSIDIFISVDTLEHIPVQALGETMAATSAILRDKGLMVNFVDYSDHFARSDPSISRFNFLSYSDENWGLHNSALHYVNRLRHSEYVKIFESNGFHVEKCETKSFDIPEDLEIDGKFRKYDVDDLRKLYGKFICRKSAEIYR